MRRFRQGATNRPAPGLVRPGAGYGRLSFGAPGPTQAVEPAEELHPQMFTDLDVDHRSLNVPVTADDFVNDVRLIDSEGRTVIDLTRE
jgi:hypothetical protein